MTFRPYDAAKDRDAAHRIFREVGWADKSPEQQQAVDLALAAGPTLVAELEGTAECLVSTVPATLRYLQEDLPLFAMANVLTSHVARRRGLATRLSALSLAREAAAGALVAGLGMFEQGYYDRLGFGTGSYDLFARFDPAQLVVERRPRPPRRLTVADWQAVHDARLVRARRHGAMSLIPPQMTHAEMLESAAKNAVGLGYCDGPGGALSHCFWGEASNLEYGPYHIRWLVYQTREQLLELLALVKSLGDQVRLVSLVEPPGIQMQALLAQPFKQQQITDHSPYAAGIRARAWWQVRICDLAGCLAHTHLPGTAMRFNLRLSDPIDTYLEQGAPWRGLAGDYIVSLGPSSGAGPGRDPALPTLVASVGAFTRLWLGVGPATGLAATDDLAGPPELLAQLDEALRLPRPMPDWEF